MRPTVRRDDPRLPAMTRAIVDLIPGAVPENVRVDVVEVLPGPGERTNSWSGPAAAVAERAIIALRAQPRTTEQRSPLAQADDAKRARDLGAELGALQQGHTALTSAPWYPARPGDVVHLAYEEAGTMPAASETYLVGDAGDGLMSLALICQTFPGLSDEDAAAMSGVFVAEAADDPLYELWFEAGPHRLTIIRDGRPVHIGGAR